MRTITDPVVLVLLALLAATLLAFFVGRFPYPYGLMVLAACLVARVLYLKNPRDRQS